MIVTVCMLVFAPLTILGILFCAAAALQVLRGSPSARMPLVLAQLVLVVLWGSACVFALLDRLDHRDWVHLFWSAQVPLVGLFLGSGALLCCTWRTDTETVRRMLSEGTPQGSPSYRVRGGGWVYLFMTLTLGVAPLFLQIVLPEDNPSSRASGEPIRRLWELTVWGFGGPLPEMLTPIAAWQVERGVSHLAREVTVPVGTTLIAAWLWIMFCVIAFFGRLIRAPKLRIALYLLAPALVLILPAAIDPCMEIVDRATSGWGGFDPDFFGPVSCENSGIWTSEPAVMRSYGPVLLAALGAAVVLLLGQVAGRFTRRTAAR